MTIFKLAIIATLATPLLWGCSKSEEGLSGQLYLPYSERCKSSYTEMLSVLNSLKIRHSATLLQPDFNFVPGYRIDSLIDLQFESASRTRLTTVANRYLSNCGPNSIIRTSIKGLDEEFIERNIINSPRAAELEKSTYDISIDGDELLIYF